MILQPSKKCPLLAPRHRAGGPELRIPELRNPGTLAHLSDSLWTSSPLCMRPLDSASEAYTWQLCFCGVWLGAVWGEEG